MNIFQNPSPKPAPEQTASIVSFLSYTFLELTIWLAYRTPHLSFDQLPPLCDYDAVKYLIPINYPVCDTYIAQCAGPILT